MARSDDRNRRKGRPLTAARRIGRYRDLYWNQALWCVIRQDRQQSLRGRHDGDRLDPVVVCLLAETLGLRLCRRVHPRNSHEQGQSDCRDRPCDLSHAHAKRSETRRWPVNGQCPGPAGTDGATARTSGQANAVVKTLVSERS